jgi:hypothetical protein
MQVLAGSQADRKADGLALDVWEGRKKMLHRWEAIGKTGVV